MFGGCFVDAGELNNDAAQMPVGDVDILKGRTGMGTADGSGGDEED